jgi:uncharacterized membrane protein
LPTILGLIALLIVLLTAVILSRRSESARSEVEQEVYGNLDGQVRSMLLQAGGALTQDRIRENLGIPVVDVSRELAALERRGDIRREWLPLDYTYSVYLSDATPECRTTTSDPSVQPGA